MLALNAVKEVGKMIEIVMDGMCKGCTRADLKLECYHTYIDEMFWSISCTHKCACDRMESKTIERLRENNEVDDSH